MNSLHENGTINEKATNKQVHGNLETAKYAIIEQVSSKDGSLKQEVKFNYSKTLP